MKDRSYVTNCFIKARLDSETSLFTVSPVGQVLVRLNGYAIVPIEEYFALIGEPVPDLCLERKILCE